MGQQEEMVFGIREIVLEYFQEQRLSRATQLARLRHFAEARDLLMLNGATPTNAAELDLLARIAAQQRQFAEAQRLWNAAAAISPETVVYRDAASLAAKAHRKWREIRQLAFAISVGVVLAVAILTAIEMTTGSGRSPRISEMAPKKQASRGTDAAQVKP